VNHQDSLSVVLPIHSGPQRLVKQVNRLLEILPEFTSEFEVLILDNGSTDHTEEVAHELARRFPQVRVCRNVQRLSSQATLHAGLRAARKDLVIIYDEHAPIRIRELVKMWELRKDRKLVIAQAATSKPSSLIDRLSAWASKVHDSFLEQTTVGGVQIVRRRALHELDRSDQRSSEPPRPSRAFQVRVEGRESKVEH
jgi:glycosyltransferase involved in cell wall biosynthesis